MDFFSDFFIIFEIAFFNAKIWGGAKNIVNTVKKWRPGCVPSSKKCFVFDLVNILKFKMWKGEGGFVFGRLQKPKIKKTKVSRSENIAFCQFTVGFGKTRNRPCFSIIRGGGQRMVPSLDRKVPFIKSRDRRSLYEYMTSYLAGGFTHMFAPSWRSAHFNDVFLNWVETTKFCIYIYIYMYNMYNRHIYIRLGCLHGAKGKYSIHGAIG